MKKPIEETIVETTVLEKPIQDRLRQASHITVESALRNKVNLNISWYNIHGEQQIKNIQLLQEQ